jgi:hypothetical protein
MTVDKVKKTIAGLTLAAGAAIGGGDAMLNDVNVDCEVNGAPVTELDTVLREYKVDTGLLQTRDMTPEDKYKIKGCEIAKVVKKADKYVYDPATRTFEKNKDKDKDKTKDKVTWGFINTAYATSSSSTPPVPEPEPEPTPTTTATSTSVVYPDDYELDLTTVAIEVIDIVPIENGVSVFARAWDANDMQIGFGESGQTDIERFRIYNPPVLVDDPNGKIEREIVYVDPYADGLATTTKTLTEDPEAALLQSLGHTITLVGKNGSNIVAGSIGNTTDTFYPDDHNESTSVDGYVYRDGADGTWALARDTADGNGHQDANSVLAITSREKSSGTVYDIIRAIALFDTSTLGDVVISSATLSLYDDNVVLINTDNDGDDTVNIVSSNPASDTDIVNGDYDTLGTTLYAAAVDFGSLTTNAYNDFALNSTGIAAIDTAGISKFGVREGHDLNDVAIAVNTQNNWQVHSADVTGTTQDPKLVVVHAAPTLADGGWDYRVAVTVDDAKVPSTQTSFPVYVDLSDLPADFHTNVATDGCDIRVSNSAGTELAHELVDYDATGDTGELHFLADSIAGTGDTTFYIYYGRAANCYATDATYGAEAVWSSYKAVYHLEGSYDGTSGEMVDSTGNGFDATSGGGTVSPTSAAGKLSGGAQDFDGTNDGITLPTFGSFFDGSNDHSVTMWVNIDDHSNNTYTTIFDPRETDKISYAQIYRNAGGTEGFYSLYQNSSTGWQIISNTTDSNNDQWYHYAASWDASGNLTQYVDAGSDGSVAAASTINADTRGTEFGQDSSKTMFFDGTVDEFRIATVPLTSDWITTEYNNQTDTSTFYTAGTQEDVQTADILVVAGGGAGGTSLANYHGGGGGGAGGFSYTTAHFVEAGTYTITVGAGGAGISDDATRGNDGGDSAFDDGGSTELAATGGGGGASYDQAAGSGGSGGGGTAWATAGGTSDAGGNNGGLGGGTSYGAGGGGGGASSVGEAAETDGTDHAGDGGAGTANSITGSSVTYAGGGAGGSRYGSSDGGTGGGGDGAVGLNTNGTSGTDNLGGGGGGATGTGTSGDGGDGVVIVRLLTADWTSITGGSQATDGDYTVVTFNSSGSLVLSQTTASRRIILIN